MRINRWLLFWGLAFILLGIVQLWNNLNLGPDIPFWPLALIALGVYIILTTTVWAGKDGGGFQRILGNIRLNWPGWQVGEGEIFTIIGDVKVDFRQAALPEGESVLRVRCIIGDIDILVPIGLAVSASVSGIIGDQRVLDRRRDGIFIDTAVASPDYANAARRVRIEISYIIGDANVRYV